MTYLEKSGNDFDQCALLGGVVAGRLVTAMPGISLAGWRYPTRNSDGSGRDLQHWLGLNSVSPLPTTGEPPATISLNLFRIFGGTIPICSRSITWPTTFFAFQRVWVTLLHRFVRPTYWTPAFKVQPARCRASTLWVQPWDQHAFEFKQHAVDGMAQRHWT